MSDWNQPLKRAEPEKPASRDPDQYIPMPGRPGWLQNGRGQLARQGATPPLVDPWQGLVPVVPKA